MINLTSSQSLSSSKPHATWVEINHSPAMYPLFRAFVLHMWHLRNVVHFFSGGLKAIYCAPLCKVFCGRVADRCIFASLNNEKRISRDIKLIHEIVHLFSMSWTKCVGQRRIWGKSPAICFTNAGLNHSAGVRQCCQSPV